MKRCTLLIVLAALLSSCGRGTPEQASAILTMTITPVPLVVEWACPQHAPSDPPPANCFLSMDPTVTLTESGGVGGRIESISITVRDTATGADRLTVSLGRDWVIANAGSDRIEAGGKLAFRPLVSRYPLPFAARPNVSLVLGAQFEDDRGNTLTPSLRVDIT